MTIVTEGKLTFVVQGTFYVSRHPDAMLSTVLGSCVSVCLFDLGSQIGGMNHFLLPSGRGSDSGHIRFGVNAMERLIKELLQGGAVRSNLQAKLFGGARMSANLMDIGKANADFAHDFLNSEAIPIASQSTGGTSARRVVFRPATGQAKMLFVANDQVELTELPMLKSAAQPGSMVLS
jgi:chemotaxis protein CheD